MFKFVVKRNTTELFHRAVAENDVLRVKLLLEQAREDPKFSINGINSEGLTALQTSCFAGNLDIVKLLVEHGANVRIKDRDGWTLLHGASLAGKLDIVQFLVANGLSVSSRNDRKQLPLDFAEELPVVMFILKRMLGEGLEEEVQRFIKRNSHLKKDIYKEVEFAIYMKKQEIKALERLPYTPVAEKRRRNVSDPSRMIQSHNNSFPGTPSHPQHRQSVQQQSHSPRSTEQCPAKCFTLDVDNLPTTPSTLNKRWSSMSNIPVVDQHLSEVKIHMHNGYETDGTDRHFLINNNNKINKSEMHPFEDQNRNTEIREADIASVNSHSTSGYETDELDHQLFLNQAKRVHNHNTVSAHYYHTHEEYQRKSKTLSPRTVRRLEHRLGSLALNEQDLEFGKGGAKKKSQNLQRVEYPEVFL